MVDRVEGPIIISGRDGAGEGGLTGGTVTPVRLGRGPDGATTRVAIVRPPVMALVGGLSFTGAEPPVGAAYIAAALRAAGHTVQVIDAPAEAKEQYEDFRTPVGTVRRIGLSPEETVAMIDPATRVVGVSHMFAHEWPTVRHIVELVKEHLPDAFVVVGGENATGYWTQMFAETDAIDAVVLGEGEATVVELVARVLAGAPIRGMQGVAVPEGPEEDRSGGLPVRFRHLEELPRPAWDLFPMESYIGYRPTLGVDRGRTMPILATRGCPYRCTFCSSPQMWTTRYTVRDPMDVADEIEEYVRTYDVQNIVFNDLTPITKRSWTIALCDEIERRGLDVSLQIPIGTRSEAIDEEVLARLKAAGCTNITFAPESGSERMLEIMDKRVDLDHLLEAIRLAHRAGLSTHIHTIIGHPKETGRDRWLTYKFMIRAAFAGLASTDAIMFHPYPGSADFIEMVESGVFRPDDTYCLDGLTRGAAAQHNWNPRASTRRLHVEQFLMVASFFALSHLLHPSRIVHLVKTVLVGGEEHTELEMFLRVKLRGFSVRRRGSESRDRSGRRAAARVPVS